MIQKKETRAIATRVSCKVAASYSPAFAVPLLSRFRSTIGVTRFNFSVRNGKRWSPCAITALFSSLQLTIFLTYAKSFVRSVDPWSIVTIVNIVTIRSFYERSVRVISIARLNTSLCVHLQPINVVVCDYPMWNSNLVASFALRCFQRLSVPDLVTRRCPWQDSRCARGQSDTVLSY